ncbi:hypothetical protein CHISP_2072 [Chitinispirillum alkaliphilum]|nr:hypothetical protein CHISP_2072 [Chitinispirillum alkaliphilum]
MDRIGKIFYHLCLVAVFITSCQRGEKVELNIDFSQSHTWRYLLGADLRGSLSCNDSSHSYSGSIRTYLQGVDSRENESSTFATNDFLVKADFLSDEQMFELRNRLSVFEMSVCPKIGVTVSDTAVFGGMPLRNWDLFKSISRAIPVMPSAPMSVGSSWEREYHIPVKTAQGQETGELYQVFRLDSVVVDKGVQTEAYISWLFSYRVSADHSDNAQASTPMSGSGIGTAVIDIPKQRILMSNASFEIDHYDNCKTELQENVHIELIR